MRSQLRSARSYSVATAVLVALAASQAFAINYTFTKVADSHDGYSQFYDATIDRVGGGVVFRATHQLLPGVFVQGVFTGSGGPVSLVAAQGDGFVAFGERPSMITVGPGHVIYFFGATKTVDASLGVWQRDETASPAIAELWPDNLGLGPHPNASGSVAFSTDVVFNGFESTNLYRAKLGTSPVELYQGGIILGDVGELFGDPTISDGETVAVNWSNAAIVEFPPNGPQTSVVSGSYGGLPSQWLTGGASVNNAGVVAFQEEPNFPAGPWGIYTGKGPPGAPVALIADNAPGSAYLDFASHTMNNHGFVVFQASRADTQGIYAGADPVAQKIIEAGDMPAPFGSPVADLRFVEGGLDDQNRIAFYAVLQDGTEGIYRASPVLQAPSGNAGGSYFIASLSNPLALDASLSASPDEPIGAYDWDLDGDGTTDWSATSPQTTVPAETVRSFLHLGGNDVRLRIRTASGAYAVDYGEVRVATECSDGVDNDGDGKIDWPADDGCTSAVDLSERADCADGIDNDGDGAVDYGTGRTNDPGCRNEGSPKENPQCNDGFDNDLDSHVDYPEDPGCVAAWSDLEAPACNDGIDNDLDGTIDFDGGASANHGVARAAPDPQCGTAWHNAEKPATGCGLGAELALVLPSLLWLRRRR